MEIKRLAGLIVAGLLCAGAASASDFEWKPASGESVWKMSSSLNMESGNYGSGTRTTSLYVPFTLKRYLGDAFASLTVPFVSQTSDGRVRNVGGRPVRIGRGSSGGTTNTQSGLGDIVARAGYDLMRDDPQPFDLTVVAKVKAPTASRDKGLGTGEFDAGGGLEFGKLVAPGWTILAGAYYTAIGDPPGSDLNNQAAVDLGVSRLLTTDLTLTALLEGSNALVTGQPDPRDARAVLEYRFDERSAAFAGVMAGLSEGSADYGFSLGGSLRF